MTTFPDGFLWGAATASHQVEGGNVNNHYWEWEHAEHTPFVEPSGDAFDHYHRWREDLDLVAGAGLTAYRFSLEWSRIEPEEGEVSRAALDHYRRMVDGCRERGPGAGGHARALHDAALVPPRRRLDRRRRPATGSRASPRSRAPALEDAEYVLTLNEPNLIAALPVLAAKARRGEQIAGLPKPDQGSPTRCSGAPARVEVLRGPACAPAWRWSARSGSPRTAARSRCSHRAAFEDQFLEAAGDVDFLGMQIYTCARFGPDGPVARAPELQTVAQHGVPPEALGASVAGAAAVLPDTPILVTENGIATADDAERIRFTERGAARPGRRDRRRRRRPRLHALEPAGQLRVVLGYEPTFGLVAVDRETFVRTPKPSLAWLGEVARRNGLTTTASDGDGL